jgi:hypothetical protein
LIGFFRLGGFLLAGNLLFVLAHLDPALVCEMPGLEFKIC